MRSRILLVAALASTAGCSKFSLTGSGQSPVVTNLRTQFVSTIEGKTDVEQKALEAVDKQAKAGSATPASKSVEGEITLRKDKLLNREFLYGFDLQYTSTADPVYSLISQTQALGHLPSFFRIIGGQLQLVGEQSRLFESVVNHPELLLATWDVVSEDADTITVKYRQSGLVINEVFNGKGAPAPKQTWVRSLKFVEQGEYLLQESGILLQDGAVQTYYESVFPRANLVPAQYVAFDIDSSVNPIADRYRFLANEKVFVPRQVGSDTVRQQTSFASRFNLGAAGTIDWYVTSNIPDRFIPAVKSGIEGWNRYFRPQLGRDVMVFKGRLPADIAIGDPRYNVVNWDSVAQAGAAYESQAADPLSGIQSHSLIYLPLAWYNIGVQLWTRRVDLNMPTAKQINEIIRAKGPEVLGASHRNPLTCVTSADDMATPIAAMMADIQNTMRDTSDLISLDEFGNRLLASVLFHEVGHSLGLAHNFKASLAFDGDHVPAADNPTTWSSMDYNYYQLEMDLFTQVGGSEGPALEYDRQIISQLYNSGRDVATTDLVVPACEDAEADNTAGGVDPLCVRYDSEKNPINGVVHSLSNLSAATGAAGTEEQTLSEVFAELKATAATRFADSARNPDAAALESDAKAFGAQVGELANYFISGGAQSVRVNLRNNSKALRTWAPGAPVDELDFRTRYSDTFKTALGLRALPATPATALADLTAAVEATIAANALAGATDADRLTLAHKASAALKAKVDTAVTKALTKMRASVYGELSYTEDSPYALLLAVGAPNSQFEEMAAQSLSNGVLMGLDGDVAQLPVYAAERSVAVAQLVSFRGIHPAVEQTLAQLQALEIRAVHDGNQALRDEARRLERLLR